MLSIIIPVYNAASHLRECLNSVLAQTSQNWELILVDDGSSDGSSSICDEYASLDSRVRVIHQENMGVSAARNVGIELASGDYVSFVDSDDWIAPVYCDTILKEVDGYDLLYFGNTCVFPSGEFVAHAPKTFSANTRLDSQQGILALKQDNSFEFFGYTWNKCFSKGVLGDKRFEIGLSFREDDLFTSSVLTTVNSVCVIPNNLYYYRMSSLGLTHNALTPNAVVRFALGLDSLISRFDFDLYKSFEHGRVAEMLFLAARLDERNKFCIFTQMYNYVHSNPSGAWSVRIMAFCTLPYSLAIIVYFIEESFCRFLRFLRLFKI